MLVTLNICNSTHFSHDKVRVGEKIVCVDDSDALPGEEVGPSKEKYSSSKNYY